MHDGYGVDWMKTTTTTTTTTKHDYIPVYVRRNLNKSTINKRTVLRVVIGRQAKMAAVANHFGEMAAE